MRTKPSRLKPVLRASVLLPVICALALATPAGTAGLAPGEGWHAGILASLAALIAPLTEGHKASEAAVIRKSDAQSELDTYLPGDHDLSIVAHEDDDLLFLSPDIPARIQAGDSVRTIFLTAGDAGLGLPYWMNREAGIQAAYAQMAGVANTWTVSGQTIGDKLIRICTLNATRNISVAFLRLPDGNVNTGGGYAVTGYQSLQRLWEGEIATISSLDSVDAYTKQELIQTLAVLMMEFEAQHIQTQDASNLYGWDHPDHRYGARFAFEAHQLYAASGAHHTFAFYRGYNISNEPGNLTQAEREAKWSVFTTYAQHDAAICGGMGTGCLLGGDYDKWSYREYPIAQVRDLSGALGVLSGGCLTAGGELVNGTAPAIILECLGGESSLGDASRQAWSINEDGSITGPGGRCSEVRGGLSLDETPVQIAACTGTPEQRWTAFENGQIRGLAGKCLDVRGGASADSPPVQLYGCVAVPGQQWILPPSSPQPLVSADFSLALAPGSSFSATVTAGESATYSLVLTPSGFAGTVALNCSSEPPGATCGFSPNPATLDGQHRANVTLSVNTTAHAEMRPALVTRGPDIVRGPAALFVMLLLGVVLTLFAPKRRRAYLPLGMTLLVVSLWAACGGESGIPGGRALPETPAGTYSFTLVATSGNLTRSLPVTLTVN